MTENKKCPPGTCQFEETWRGIPYTKMENGKPRRKQQIRIKCKKCGRELQDEAESTDAPWSFPSDI